MKQVLWVLLILAPAMLWAQEDFGPVQLDEGQAMNYYYPRVEANGSGNLLCAWSGVLPEEGTGFIKTEGAHVSPQGQVGERVIFQQVPFGVVTCPGELHLLHGADGSNPFMLYHS